MRISFHEWDDSAPARRDAASLGNDEVQVWTATMPQAENGSARHALLLSPDERARAEKFRASEPRRQFVFGRGVLRQVLGACLKTQPAALVFGQQPRGKLFLFPSALTGDFDFNLSHSGRKVAIVLARGRKVGVDIESMQRLDDWMILAGRIFSPRELDELFSLPKPQQQKAFFNGWTRKEAYLKATGEGLTDDLPSIEITLAHGKEPELLGLPAGLEVVGQWSIRDIPLPPDYAGTVVFEKCSSAGNSSPSSHQ